MPNYHALTSFLSFPKTNVVVIGGTQGIGAGIALRFAELGASVLVVGRNEKLGNDMVEALKGKAKSGGKDVKFGFFKKDLGTVKAIKEVVEEIAEWAGEEGVQYLLQSQGGPSCFMPPTPSNVSAGFNVQIVSHFLIPYLLLTRSPPILREGSQICNIARPGEINRQIDFDDFNGVKAAEEGKFSVFSHPYKWVFMIDVFTHEFNVKFPATHTTHLFPGPVSTNLFNAPGVPIYIRCLFKILSYFKSLTPAQYADIAVWQIASDEGKGKKRTFWDPNSGEPKVDKRVEGDSDEDREFRNRVWEELMKLGEV